MSMNPATKIPNGAYIIKRSGKPKPPRNKAIVGK